MAQLKNGLRVWALFLLLAACGCGIKGRRDAENVDALLRTGPVDRVEILLDEQGKTNVFSGDRAAQIVRMFNPTNRVPRLNSFWRKNYSTGRVAFYQGTNYLIGFHYVPEYGALSRGNYYFALKGTNDLQRLFH